MLHTSWSQTVTIKYIQNCQQVKFIRSLCTRISETRVFNEGTKLRVASELEIDPDRLILTCSGLRKWRNSCSSQSIGLVPTMGALHEGHLALLKRCREENEIAVSSIFINPAQFAPHEDFSRYPWTPKSDIAQMIKCGADKIFIPSQLEIYPDSMPGQTFHSVSSTLVVPVGVDEISEGKSRPGFFTGVSTVVAKLFNLFQPHRAYFGQKDGLQVMSIRRMVRDLNFPLEVVPCETVRESDGLAKSSRNIYLNEEQRAIAPTLYESLLKVKNSYDLGERNYSKLIDRGIAKLQNEAYRIEYLSICDALSGKELLNEMLPEGNLMVSAAINFGNCRLIDNILMGKQT